MAGIMRPMFTVQITMKQHKNGKTLYTKKQEIQPPTQKNQQTKPKN